MNIQILNLLAKNARYTVSDLAVMTGLDEAEVEANIKELEVAGLIRGYKAVIDWERLDNAYVSAVRELKVVPQDEYGFEKVAENIMKYNEVESVYLMSGACDLIVTVKGRTFREVSDFLSKELALIDSVTSTATQFIMRRYKEFGVELISSDDDERGNFSL